MKTCALFHGNFFGISLNIMSSVLPQSEVIKHSTYFSPVHSFAKNSHYADFAIHVTDTQHLFRLSGVGQVPLLKCRNTKWCSLSGQGSGGLLGSKNPVAIGIAFMQHMEPEFR